MVNQLISNTIYSEESPRGLSSTAFQLQALPTNPVLLMPIFREGKFIIKQ
jgi:hypothetical protein